MQLRYNLITGILLLALSVSSQSTIDALLADVQSNNKRIQVAQKKLDADKALYQTGLSLPDPQFTFDWMKGSPSTVGNQTEFIAAQPFDLPSVYKYRRQVSSLRTDQTDFAYEQLRKDILLEAKQLAIRLVYHNKRRSVLSDRLVHAERFYEKYRIKLVQQDATILELNKAGLLLFNISADLQLVDTEIRELTQKLIELNGGIPILIVDTSYPAEDILPEFESLESLIEATDPQLKYLEMQQQIGEAEQKLTKATLWPSFEAGYRYQGLPGQNFHGIHTGVSIPLWGNKQKKNYPLQVSNLYVAMIEEHKVEHYHEIKQLYDQYELLRQNMQLYESNFAQISNTEILDKALESGQITVLEYYLESTIYFGSLDRYLELESTRQKVLADLLKYKL